MTNTIAEAIRHHRVNLGDRVDPSMKTRRSILRFAGVAGLGVVSGCLGWMANGDGGGARSYVRVSNRSFDDHELGLIVVDDSTGVRLLDTSVSLDQDESRRIDFESEIDRALVTVMAEMNDQSKSLEAEIKAGGSTGFFFTIESDNTVSGDIGMQ